MIVIVEGNSIGGPSSSTGWGSLHFPLYLSKLSIDHCSLKPIINNKLGWAVSFCKTTSLRKGKHWIKNSCILFKQNWVWFGLVYFYSISIIVGDLKPNLFLYIWLVLFQTIQFNISRQFSSIWTIDKNLSGATTLGQSVPGSDGNKVVRQIYESVIITGASPSDCLVSFLGPSLEGVLPKWFLQLLSTGPK